MKRENDVALSSSMLQKAKLMKRMRTVWLMMKTKKVRRQRMPTQTIMSFWNHGFDFLFV